jgi:hypothetical protein
MRAPFNNFTSMQHNDLICVSDCRKAMTAEALVTGPSSCKRG